MEIFGWICFVLLCSLYVFFWFCYIVEIALRYFDEDDFPFRIFVACVTGLFWPITLLHDYLFGHVS